MARVILPCPFGVAREPAWIALVHVTRTVMAAANAIIFTVSVMCFLVSLAALLPSHQPPGAATGCDVAIAGAGTFRRDAAGRLHHPCVLF